VKILSQSPHPDPDPEKNREAENFCMYITVVIKDKNNMRYSNSFTYCICWICKNFFATLTKLNCACFGAPQPLGKDVHGVKSSDQFYHNLS
jgi:hypothetical protein